MTITIGLVANVYQEANALPGWLETHLPFFDDVRVLHAGPGGDYSTDGTIELLARWRVPYEFCSIDEGFGAVRTRAIRMSPCDYVMILDADERFYPIHRTMVCEGEPTPQHEVDQILSKAYDLRAGRGADWDQIARLGEGLRVTTGEAYNQGAYLRSLLEARHPDALVTVRRHWHGLDFRRPTQNWRLEPDWQLRTVRNDPAIAFDTGSRMHERLRGQTEVLPSDPYRGPFFDHFHFHFKRMEVGQRAHDVAIYDSIHEGRRPPTWSEFNSGGD